MINLHLLESLKDPGLLVIEHTKDTWSRGGQAEALKGVSTVFAINDMSSNPEVYSGNAGFYV